MKKIIFLLLLLIVSGVAQAQSFELSNKNDQSHVGDMKAGDGMILAQKAFKDPISQENREWIYLSRTTGVYEFNTIKKFSHIFEKKNGTFVKRTTDSIEFLSQGSAIFAQFNTDGYPDFANTGIDANNRSRTYTYIYHKDSLKLSQELYGVRRSTIASIPHVDGDGLVFSGLRTEDNTYKTKIVKNDHQGGGNLFEVFDGIGGVGGNAHVADLTGTGELIPTVHGTKNGQGFNKNFEPQSNGTYLAADNGLPILENGVSLLYDYDRDGDLDWYAAGTITSFQNSPRLILIYLNDGNGAFMEHQRIPCGGNMQIALIDTDTDGYKESLLTMGSSWNGFEYDLVPFKIVDGKFQKWEHNPFDSESTITDFGRGFNNGKIIVTDMNGDGKDDVVLLGRTTDSSASWGNYKAQLYLNTTTSLSVTDHALSADTRVYPNPTSGTITIDLPTGSDLKKCALYDVSGRQIHTLIGMNTIDMSRYASGVYLLKFQTTDGKIGKKKIMKN